MAIAKPPQSGRISLVARNPLGFTIKALTCAALIMVFWALQPVPTVADPNSGGTDANSFGGLSCSCGPTAPADGATRKQHIRRGIQQGLSGGPRD
ncbi:hypothetical protein MMAN_20980 [Mycobacterium mantenii]|uniref:Secreted protein n=1 Tax=Mycobacterium mantenii TaxID=560555 RepID=A0ABM7JR23_MYCNT|nr:hypothetical protein [Mycobacterium mantenii]MCV7246164.1 hypothetical protein [Mycobacterium mantenii]BBY37964.1 hypothetical protein MMAN_20980 [Mycobacterium mantenii]